MHQPLSGRLAALAPSLCLLLLGAGALSAADGIRERLSINADWRFQANDAAEVAGSKHCGAGSATVTVDPFGNVYPCVQWRRRVGNLHEQSIQTTWRQSREGHCRDGAGVASMRPGSKGLPQSSRRVCI